MTTTRLTVNETPRAVDADPAMPLVWALREVLGLTGTKFSCGIGLCGACTVHLDGEPVCACMTSLGDAAGKAVTTIEGLSSDGAHPLQEAWIAEQVVQCGYCQPGMIMQAAALLSGTRRPGREEIIAHMNGNICRCGTYNRIIRAVERAAREDADNA